MPPHLPGECFYPGCHNFVGLEEAWCAEHPHGHPRPAKLAPDRRLPAWLKDDFNTLACDPSDAQRVSACGYRLVSSRMDPDTGQIVQVWAIEKKSDEGC